MDGLSRVSPPIARRGLPTLMVPPCNDLVTIIFPSQTTFVSICEYLCVSLWITQCGKWREVHRLWAISPQAFRRVGAQRPYRSIRLQACDSSRGPSPGNVRGDV